MSVTYPYITLDQCSPLRKQYGLDSYLYIKLHQNFSPETYEMTLASVPPRPPALYVYCLGNPHPPPNPGSVPEDCHSVQQTVNLLTSPDSSAYRSASMLKHLIVRHHTADLC